MISVREAAFDIFRSHHLTTVFGNPGSTELPMLAGLPPDFRYVLGLQEGVVVGMADGYAQATGRPALVNLHSAPGVATAMGALVNAAAARTPLVLTAGQQVRALLTGPALLTNPEPTVLPRPLVKWSVEPPRAEDVPAALARAAHLAALPPRGPVLVSLPMDDWTAQVEVDQVRILAERRVSVGAGVDAQLVRNLAARLAAARSPVLLVGAGLDSPAGWVAAVRLADRCRLPVHWAPLEPRCGFPTTHPAFQGVLPATEAGVGKALRGHDFVLVAGASAFRYYPYAPGQLLGPDAELVLLTDDPDEAARASLGQAVLADPVAVLAMLAEEAALARTGPRAPGPRPEPVDDPEGQLSAAGVYAAIARVLPPDGVVVCESVSNMRDCQDQIRLRRPGGYYSPAGASLGFGVPAAIGVQLAQPDRSVTAVVGDGALQYALPALWTAASYDVPVTIVVLRNDRYAVLEDFRDFLGLAEVPGLRVPGIDTVALARAYGVAATRADGAGELADALHDGLGRTGPTVIEVPIDGAAEKHW
ncbi:benzoylformate decarboxylase [Micromonospora sp. NPDC093277]|uniref:benzoylformate decarboxylase n=1 Tax=Micromonospora sp. NPDC093277 TaxID=3364291 RepID=UPI0038270348